MSNLEQTHIDIWKLRRVSTGQVRADELTPHPHNPKIHPQKQRRLTATSINSVGQMIPIIVNITNNYIVDGHDRAWIALQHGDDTLVDVDYVELSEAEHLLAMQLIDEAGRHFQYDKQKMDELLNLLSDGDDEFLQNLNTGDERLQSMLSEMAEEQGLYFGDHAFNPNTTPTIETHHYTDDDMEAGRRALDENKMFHSKETKPVMCPHCGETFYVSK